MTSSIDLASGFCGYTVNDVRFPSSSYLYIPSSLLGDCKLVNIVAKLMKSGSPGVCIIFSHLVDPVFAI
jgi:hypothetical protein